MKVHSMFLQTEEAPIYTYYLKAPNQRADGLTVVLLHGAGQSSSERFASLAKSFAESGVSVIALDFIGHGKTGGDVSANSLALRTKHALAVIAHWTKPATPLIVCGSSMSGHTALRVTAKLGTRVKSLGLLQPAVYAAEAEDVLFGPEFTRILHQPESWRSSLALRDAQHFKGAALVMIGSEDPVIPWSVVEEVTKALKTSAATVRLDVIGGVAHELPTWLPGHPEISRQLIQYLVS